MFGRFEGAKNTADLDAEPENAPTWQLDDTPGFREAGSIQWAFGVRATRGNIQLDGQDVTDAIAPDQIQCEVHVPHPHWMRTGLRPDKPEAIRGQRRASTQPPRAKRWRVRHFETHWSCWHPHVDDPRCALASKRCERRTDTREQNEQRAPATNARDE